jgi:hypothetical protein
MKTLYKQVTISPKAVHYEVFEHNGKKFLALVKADNGNVLGFNSDCCLKVMTSDGDWSNVVDNRLIGVRFDKDSVYYGSANPDAKKRLLEEPVKAFKDYVEKIY